MLILAIVAAVSMPAGHATNNVHTLFTNATTVGTCGTLCKGLSTTSGSASSATVQTSLAIGSSPAEDTNAASNKAATWTSGTTISITSYVTNQSPDTVLVFVASSKTTTPIQSAPSAAGFTCDASARKEFAQSTGVGLSEWVCHTTAAISSETVTCNLSATPTWAICQVITINGAEDPTGTFSPFDKSTSLVCKGNRNSGGGTAIPSTSTGSDCASAVASLNANDLFIAASGDTGANTQTAGAIGCTTGTLDISTTSTGALAVEHRSVTATLSASSCNFGTAVSRWIIFCDAIQSAPKYYKIEPETSASLTGTPSTAANGFSGTGWVYNVAGIQNGLFDIQSGTWQIDLTGAVGSTTGTPVARYFVTAWSCTTNSCTTATLLGNNWDTATTLASPTTATLRTYTTASQSQITWTSSNFIAFEVWVAWQYSGTTTTTTMTETTISTAMDFITPGWDYAQGLSGSMISASAFAKITSMFKSLSGSLSSVSSFVEKTSIFKALAASITLTMGNMAANVNSGQLTCNSSPRSCSTPLTATWNLGSGVARRSSLFRFLSGSLSLTTSETKGITKALSGSLSLASSFAERSSLFRSLTGSLSSASSLTERISVLRSLSGAWTMTSGLAEKSTLFRSLIGSLCLAASLSGGRAIALTGSLGSASSFAEKSSLFRSLTGSLSLTGSQIKGLARALSDSMSSGSSFAEKSSMFRSLSGSLSSASNFAERSSLFRSLSGSLGLAASQVKGLARALTGSLSSASGFSERSSLFRSLSGALTMTSGLAERSSLFRSLSSALTVVSGFAERSSMFRSLSGSLGLAGYEGKGHTFYYGSASQTGCAVKCEQLATTTGAVDTTTSVKVGSSTTCCFEVQPDVGSSITTATPSTTTPTGQAWVYPSDLGGITIQSGSWEFDTTITASRTGTANMRFLVWSCLTSSEGTCTLLFDFTGTANIEATTSATKSIDVSPIEGPFSNVHFLTVEVWISPTVSTGVPSATDTMTTVSGASDVITPAWRYGQNLFATLNAASSFAEKSSLFRSLSGSLSIFGSQVAGRAFILSASLGSSSSLAEKSSLFRSLSGSLSLAASQLNRLAISLFRALGSVSSLAEKNSLFRALTGSLSVADY